MRTTINNRGDHKIHVTDPNLRLSVLARISPSEAGLQTMMLCNYDSSRTSRTSSLGLCLLLGVQESVQPKQLT